MTITEIANLITAVKDAAHNHFPWCVNHDYNCDDPDPRAQLCRAEFGLDFTSATDRDEVKTVEVELSGSQLDVENGHPVPTASIGYNGFTPDREIATWKLVPIAYALLAAEARSRGDKSLATAFMDAAEGVVSAHYIETAETEPEPTPTAPVRHWTQGPFSYVQGGDPDSPPIPWDAYQAAQKAEASESADESKYLDEQMDVLTGRFAGHRGIVDEVDLADADKPLRLRFEELEGEPIEWYGLNDVEFAGGAR